MGLHLIQIAVGGLDDNFAYVVYDDVSKDASIVDPSGSVEKIFEVINAQSLSVVAIWLTHTHHDHIDGLAATITQCGDVPIYVHELSASSIGSYKTIRTVSDHATLTLNAIPVTVFHTPGHTDDSVCFYIKSKDAHDGIPKVITGDTLFVEGCGRTSEHRVKDLYESLAELGNLPDETEVFPGHDYGSKSHSTTGYEKEHNKYYLTKNFSEFKKIRLG